MDLSSATDTTLQALTQTRTLSYPGYTLPGGVCSFAGGSQLYRLIEDEPIAQVQNNSLRMKIDSSKGASGAPWFFCPELDDDECLSEEPGWVYGVNSGYNSVIDRQVGAKVPYFKDDALAIIDGTYVEQ
jgi:hypothetical protein